MEQYTPGESPLITEFMERRSLASHGQFFRPFLWSGAQVLDCGCGPGTITVGLAECVAPDGQVCAIDFNPRQVELAREALRGHPNVDCRPGSIYSLPFADNSFDAVFAHALFEHLKDPAGAARELLRVLKPGGFAGVRSPDWTGKLTSPCLPEVDAALTAYAELQASNGGDLNIGRKLNSILTRSGFVHIRSQANYECYRPVQVIGEYLARQIESTEIAGYPTGDHLGATLRSWCTSPEAFFAQAWCEVVGRKPIL